MKTSLTKLSSSFILLTFSLGVLAKPVAQVVDVSGTVFVVNEQGMTSALKLNQHIEDKSEILVEEGAGVTLNDYYDATYHLTGGSHLKFFNKSVQLKKGKTWVESSNARYPLALTTANGHVDYVKGEFIATFDQLTNRSQILVVNGQVDVSNILNKNLKYTVTAGSFTMVDPEVENGLPRAPTRVGLQSLDQALAEFKQIPKKSLTPETLGRTIASAKEEKPVQRGEIIYIVTNRKPASVEKKMKLHKYKQSVVEMTPVPIKIYGTAYSEPIEKIAPRTPASVKLMTPSVPKMSAPVVPNDHEFSESLKKQESLQPKYSKELQNLIDDLKSY